MIAYVATLVKSSCKLRTLKYRERINAKSTHSIKTCYTDTYTQIKLTYTQIKLTYRRHKKDITDKYRRHNTQKHIDATKRHHRHINATNI